MTQLAPDLRRHPSGYWTTSIQELLSYPEEGNQAYFQIEDASFWFHHRREAIVETVRAFPPAGTLFDIGGGNGHVAQGLERAGIATVIVEPGPQGAANSCARGIKHVVCATVESAGFRPRSLPAAGLFDVVEHLPDDVAFLGRLRALLSPGARLYLTVPAFNFLWSSEDVLAGHYRRYSLRTLSKSLQKAGFQIEYATYLFWTLPIPILLCRTLPTVLGWQRSLSVERLHKEHSTNPGLFQRMMNELLASELSQIRRKRRIPFGTSCLAVARSVSD